MIDTLQLGLLVFTRALLVPTLILLGLGAAITIALAGGLIGEGLRRRRSRSTLTACVARLVAAPASGLRPAELPVCGGAVGRAIEQARAAPASAQKALDDLQLRIERHLDLLGLGVRLGPMLGLAGTLIPIGPALVALSTGDIETLARQLVVAFGTTVVGLLVGGGCSVVHTCRRSWYAQDLDDASFVLERLAQAEP